MRLNSLLRWFGCSAAPRIGLRFLGEVRITLAELKKCQGERDTCGQQLTETTTRLEGEVATVTTERDRGEGQARQRRGPGGGDGEEPDTTKDELVELRKQRAEAEKRLAAFKALTAKFQAMIDSGKIKVVFRGGRMLVSLPAGILFASGKADLSKEGQTALAEVAGILKEFPDRNFMVAGHTDAAPLRASKFKDNWELSSARALTS